ncbi:MAG: hypothetical protein VKN72_25390 [Nostocales cyanobacterium 94392]|nr:hypothetical protein [Nostocales cyanobacterium 94392]
MTELIPEKAPYVSAEIELYKQKKAFLKNSTLVLISFATAFFPRIIDSLGAPPPINFVHFAIVPLACGIVIIKTKVTNRNQISIAKNLIIGIFILLSIMTASALLNNAGLINIFVNMMLLGEPFILLLAIICIPMSQTSLKQFRIWILSFVFVHILIALAQKFLITVGILRVTSMTAEDNIQGVFYISGSGHVVGASISMSFALYYFITAKTAPIWLRGSVLFAAFFQLLSADAKQVLMVFLAAWLLLIVLKFNDIKTTLQYIIAATLIIYAFYWCMENLESFRAFKTWIRPEIYEPDGAATLLKTGPFRIIPSYYKSSFNWLFGLGPGHTIGRLGGWMLKDYGNLLIPLGATIHPASEAVWNTWRGHWLDSSFFSPLWGWAAIWGDLGFLGLGAYLYLCSIVWQRICLDDFSRFMMLSVLLFGLIFTQMEEPGYMMSVASLLGLRWQEIQIERSLKRHSLNTI